MFLLAVESCLLVSLLIVCATHLDSMAVERYTVDPPLSGLQLSGISIIQTNK